MSIVPEGAIKYPFEFERQRALKEFYDKSYSGGVIEHDSPDQTRRELIRGIACIAEYGHVEFDTSVAPLTVLNLGSGPQALEEEYFDYAKQRPERRLRELLSATRFITLDIASIPRQRLLFGSDCSDVEVHHVTASSSQIPLKDESINVVISNMSVDMLRVVPDDYDLALSEIARVLRPEGKLITTFHHPKLYESYARSKRRDPTSDKGIFFNPDAHNPFYGDSVDIVTDFALSGLEVEVARLHREEFEQWWHVEARKGPEVSLAG